MIPIIEKQYAQVFVVVAGGGPVDDDATEYTFPCLKRKVGVVPGGTVLSGSPSVGHRFTGGGWALRDRT